MDSIRVHVKYLEKLKLKFLSLDGDGKTEYKILKFKNDVTGREMKFKFSLPGQIQPQLDAKFGLLQKI